ncbi:MAG TPA: GNAT family N-acetyltransferase [Saprospirales bacterium]|nr:GNAT family N-acetyltransferase [Saprospirales bacterium]
MHDISLQHVDLNDIRILQKIGRETFYESFAAVNTPENMQHYLDESFSEAALTEELSNPEMAYFFALIDKEPVGYLKLNFGAAQTDIQDDTSVEIQRIYVRKEFQGQKIGQFLFEHAVAIARQRGAEYIWLGVWDGNPNAIRFYERNGFVTFGQHEFMLGDDRQRDWLMRLDL